MKRFAHTIIALIVVANIVPMNALACGGGGGGGYRPAVRSYYNPSPIYRQAAPIYRQPVVQRTIIQQPIAAQPRIRTVAPQPAIRIAPTQRAQVATPQPTRTAQAAAPQQTATQQPQATAPQTNNNNSNSNVNSALALLSGQQAQPSATPAPAATANSSAKHIGSWTANVGSEATVQLNLQADGSFQWVASKGGKQSRFDGQFTITDRTLTLARSSDNQKLSGELTFNGNGFNFKLNGAKDSGLNFAQRS